MRQMTLVGFLRGAEVATLVTRGPRRLQESGRADPDLDPLIAAHALSGMVGRIAYSVYNLGERIPFERLVTTLNQLWVNALKLDQTAPRPPGRIGR